MPWRNIPQTSMKASYKSYAQISHDFPHSRNRKSSQDYRIFLGLITQLGNELLKPGSKGTQTPPQAHVLPTTRSSRLKIPSVLSGPHSCCWSYVKTITEEFAQESDFSTKIAWNWNTKTSLKMTCITGLNLNFTERTFLYLYSFNLKA